MPDISVVIVTCNRAARLATALESWTAVRFGSGWELIVVDNNSSDSTAAVVDGFRKTGLPIRYVLCRQPGAGAARETGRLAAQGLIVLYVDDDCYPATDLLEQYSAVFAEHTEIGFCGGRILLWDQSDAMVTVDYRTQACSIAAHDFHPAGTLHSANLAIQREVLEAIGGFDSSFGPGTAFVCEDADVVSRAAIEGFSGRFDPRPVVFHHHGRKDEEASGLQRSYAQGRGAHYMKSLLDPRSRLMAAKSWWHLWRGSLLRALRTMSVRPLIPRFIELESSLRYLATNASSKRGKAAAGNRKPA